MRSVRLVAGDGPALDGGVDADKEATWRDSETHIRFNIAVNKPMLVAGLNSKNHLRSHHQARADGEDGAKLEIGRQWVNAKQRKRSDRAEPQPHRTG